MNTIDFIKALILEEIEQDTPWIIEANNILYSTLDNSYERLPIPGFSRSIDICANLKIRKDTTTAAGIRTWGMNETIERVGTLPPDSYILSFGYKSLEKLALYYIYFTTMTIVLVGCVIVEITEKDHELPDDLRKLEG